MMFLRFCSSQHNSSHSTSSLSSCILPQKVIEFLRRESRRASFLESIRQLEMSAKDIAFLFSLCPVFTLKSQYSNSLLHRQNILALFSKNFSFISTIPPSYFSFSSTFRRVSGFMRPPSLSLFREPSLFALQESRIFESGSPPDSSLGFFSDATAELPPIITASRLRKFFEMVRARDRIALESVSECISGPWSFLASFSAMESMAALLFIQLWLRPFPGFFSLSKKGFDFSDRLGLKRFSYWFSSFPWLVLIWLSVLNLCKMAFDSVWGDSRSVLCPTVPLLVPSFSRSLQMLRMIFARSISSSASSTSLTLRSQSLSLFSCSLSGQSISKYRDFFFILRVMQLQKTARSHLSWLSMVLNRKQRYSWPCVLSFVIVNTVNMQGWVWQSTFSISWSLTPRYWVSSVVPSWSRISLVVRATRQGRKVSTIISMLFLEIFSFSTVMFSTPLKSLQTVNENICSSLSSSFSAMRRSLSSKSISCWQICSLSRLYCFMQMLSCVMYDFFSSTCSSTYLQFYTSNSLEVSMILLIALFLLRFLRYSSFWSIWMSGFLGFLRMPFEGLRASVCLGLKSRPSKGLGSLRINSKYWRASSMLTVSFFILNRIQIITIPMREFQTSIYSGIPPFGTCLFHRDTEPKDENFIHMARFTFFPYFDLYTFAFFWLILITFVFFYSLTIEPGADYIKTYNEGEFLRVSQSALFNLGENYPYHIVNNYHYYRILTSMVLFRNFYHFILVAIGVLTIASYVEKIMGFKRCFVLAIVSGVAGILCNNIFFYNTTLESTTPVFGLIGYLLGYLLEQQGGSWRYYYAEKVQMLLLLGLIIFLNVRIATDYTNVNILSNMVSLVFGLLFQLGDPGENNRFSCRNVFIIFVMSGALAIIVIFSFFHSFPGPIQP